jgi:glycosyltransferase involved in cell wall biosynthesis
MERAARAMGLGGAIRFAGYLDEPELRRAYEQMDALLLTSDREGMPVSLLEAAAMEVCVVAAEVGGVPELVRHGETGLLAPPGDAGALAEAVWRLRGDPALAQRLRSAGRRLVEERFSAERAARDVEGVYGRLLGLPEGRDA